MSAKDEVQNILAKFTPEEKAFVESVATLRIENRQMHNQIELLKKQHDEFWRVLITIVDASPNRELRIHESQFLRFKEEYRLDRSFDEETREVVFKLLTLKDKIPADENKT